MRPSLKQAAWTLFSLSFVVAFIWFTSTHFSSRRYIGEAFPPVPHLRYTAADLKCLADNIYHEARGEPVEGQIAVAQVTLNRARLQSKSICAIVYQPGQFSWVGKAKEVARNSPIWVDAKLIALGVLRGHYFITELAKATFYHATYIRPPYWARTKEVIIEIGRHRFYA